MIACDEAVMRANGHSGQPKRHRPGEQERADVVAASQVEDRPRESFERLAERDPCRKQERYGQAGWRKDREHDEPDRAESRADELEPQRADEEPSQATPILAGRIAEAVLHERFLHREIEERLEERGREENGGVVAETRWRMEFARRNDGCEKPEDDG